MDRGRFSELQFVFVALVLASALASCASSPQLAPTRTPETYAGLKDGFDRIRVLEATCKSGEVRESHCFTLFDVEVRRLRQQYPQHRADIDAFLGTVTLTTATPRPPTVAQPPLAPPLLAATLPPQRELNMSLPGWRPARVARPEAIPDRQVSSKELFKLVGPSVYMITADDDSSQLISQGSAVAVSKSAVITNCHVVARSKRITVHVGSRKVAAHLKSADVKTDRCYLEIGGDELAPVVGVRDFMDLSEGERVYAVGAPRGLDKSVSDGLISGKRTKDGIKLVQSTAQISKGSSGGGLFDERGNLVGITTFTLKESQGLNFALAASEYWR
jgi:S1-C subfamily serine protease